MLLVKYTVIVHHTFNNGLYRLTDGLKMGHHLGPILTNSFLVKLKNMSSIILAGAIVLVKWAVFTGLYH